MAKTLCLDGKRETAGERPSLTEIVRDDFRQLRAKGISHPDMDRIEKLLD